MKPADVSIIVGGGVSVPDCHYQANLLSSFSPGNFSHRSVKAHLLSI